MYCRNCGLDLGEGYTRCPRCGTPVDNAWGVSLFNRETGKANYRCGDCSLCNHRISCASKESHRRAQKARGDR